METAMLQANALTTLPALKAALGMSDEDISSDSLLIQLINRASTSVERALGRKLRRSDYVERLKGTGSQYLLVEHYPIVHATSQIIAIFVIENQRINYNGKNYRSKYKY